MGTVGNVFELFDVSLTEGSVAPPFQVPDYASELALCQRYYRIVIPPGVGLAGATTQVFMVMQHPGLRTAPTATALVAMNFTNQTTNFAQSSAQVGTLAPTADGGTYTFGNLTGLTIGVSYQCQLSLSTNRVALNARL